jgi:hypothetical protein
VCTQLLVVDGSVGAAAGVGLTAHDTDMRRSGRSPFALSLTVCRCNLARLSRFPLPFRLQTNRSTGCSSSRCCTRSKRPAILLPSPHPLQDYPEHRLQFFSLLRAITNHCSTTLFAMSPVRCALIDVGWLGLLRFYTICIRFGCPSTTLIAMSPVRVCCGWGLGRLDMAAAAGYELQATAAMAGIRGAAAPGNPAHHVACCTLTLPPAGAAEAGD